MSTPKKTFKQTVTIKTDQENPEPLELIAKSIIGISDAMDKINKSPLRRRALLLLIKDALPGGINPTLKEIESILDTVPRLKSIYLKA